MGYMVSNAGDKSNYTAYTEGKEIVESIPFDELDELNGETVKNGNTIWVKRSREYPYDRLIKYKSIIFPVENHDGESVVVATYAEIRE